MNTTTKNYIMYTIATILVVLAVYYLYTQFVKESFTPFKDMKYGDGSIEILPECKDITPIKLLQLSGGDSKRLSELLSKYEVPLDLVSNPSSYPYIASFLVKTGDIKC